MTQQAALSAPPATLPIVCFAFGDLYGMAEAYVSRLYDMLARHCRQPFRLYCYTDQPRRLPAQVEQRDCADWNELERTGMRPTTRKLGLFNPRYVEFDRFLYLDLSLIVRRDMSALIADAFSRPEGLVIVQEWVQEGYNSSVMRIHRGGLAAIYEAFVEGERYEQRVPGDQDFIRGVVLRHGLTDRVAHFRAGQIVSFKGAVRTARRNASAARQLFQQATIVKFHGSPKMHEAFSPRYGLRVRCDELLHGNLRPVAPLRELRKEWHGNRPWP
jgi:hypothetical protein